MYKIKDWKNYYFIQFLQSNYIRKVSASRRKHVFKKY